MTVVAEQMLIVTAGDAGTVTTSTLTPGCAEVLGCMDVNASNYEATATAQAYDQYGNLSCIYASCDDVPEYGCIYVDGFGAFNATFNAANCVTYGGTPCEEPAGCTDPCMQMRTTTMHLLWTTTAHVFFQIPQLVWVI